MNDLSEPNESKDPSQLFVQKFGGHRWLENSKALNRVTGIYQYLKGYFYNSKDKMKVPLKNFHFSFVMKKLGSLMHLAALHFSFCIPSEIEPYAILLQAEQPLVVFLFEKS